MSVKKYNKIINKARKVRSNVKSKYKLGVTSKWSYYFAKSIIAGNKKDVKKLKFIEAVKSNDYDYISKGVTRKTYLQSAKNLIEYVEEHHQLPAYLTIAGRKISPELYTYFYAHILLKFKKTGLLPDIVNCNSKVFNDEKEYYETVYKDFVKYFGKFNNTIDGALQKIAGNGYAYYYDDKYTNHESIKRMKKKYGVNCTDSCQVFYNIGLKLVKMGKYKKIECLHVQCSSGAGHVRLRLKLLDGSYIYRDPASVLSNGEIRGNWCLNGTLLAVNPSWFIENLNR